MPKYVYFNGKKYREYRSFKSKKTATSKQRYLNRLGFTTRKVKSGTKYIVYMNDGVYT